MPRTPRWLTYILRCADGTLYTGVTNDLARRLAAHNAGRGAKYTATRGPVELLWHLGAKDRSAAQKREAAIKALSRAEKFAIVTKWALRREARKRKIPR